MASLFGRKVVAYKVNKSGGAVAAGDIVVPDTTNDNAFTTTTSAGVTTGVWVADEAIANNATGRVVLEGHVTLVNVSASVTRGHLGTTHTVAKQAVSTGGTTRGVGTFCKFTTGGTTPEADIWPVDLLGSSLTDPTTTRGDIITRGAAALQRLALGAAGKLLSSDGTDAVWGQGPLTTDGDLMLGATAGTPTRLAVGATAGFLLKSAGSGAPSWAWPTFVGASITEATAQSLSHATHTALTSNDAEIADTHAFHDTGSNTSRLTIPANFAGKYRATAYVEFAGNTTGMREAYIRLNGSTVLARQAANAIYNAGYNGQISVTTPVFVGAVSDYYEVAAYQDSGGNLNATLKGFSIEFLGV